MNAHPHAADPLGMTEKRALIRSQLERYGLRTMVETGLYNGRGSGMEMLDLVDEYIVIDFLETNCQAARGNCPEATVICGDSGALLPGILGSIVDGPALFWLDAHAWIGPEFGETPLASPLLAELDAIVAWPHAGQSVVLVDDLRQMADRPLAQPGWPSNAEIMERVRGAGWWIVEADDVLRLAPRA